MQAIHPGYGFLSENPDFAEVCRSSGFEFIGPPHEAIRKMGLKTEAKQIAGSAKVACVPGSDGVIASDAQAYRMARTIGYPVLIKAAAGGGGKGMRVCRDESSLSAAVQAARTEAEAAFKNSSIYLEKFIDRPRHVEVQILADAHGRIVLAGTAIAAFSAVIKSWSRSRRRRACRSRFARDWEKPPSDWLALPAMSMPALASSLSTPKTVLLHRSQRPHPGRAPRYRVVTGIDLVKQQIRIAAGEPLPFRQEEIVIRGHSIECRINSEDPDNAFRPSPGRITALSIPGGAWRSLGFHIQAGYTVPPHYDSLLGKLIVHASNRDRSPRHLRRALDELQIDGVHTTIPLHRKIVRHPDFIAAKVDTTWVERVLLSTQAHSPPG